MPQITPIEPLWTKSLFTHACARNTKTRRQWWKTFQHFWNLASYHSNQQERRWRCFANNKAWMIPWKVCRKDWHSAERRPQIGLCREISNLYKVSSVFNLCLSFTKQVNHKVSSIAKNYAEQSDWSKTISLAITRQITQEDKFITHKY